MSRRAPLPRPQAARNADHWMQVPVSSRSRFGDDVWHLDIRRPGVSPGRKWLAWGVPLPDGCRLTDSRHAGLLRATKQFLWSMAVDLPRGQKRPSPCTLLRTGMILRVVIGWMVSNALTSFDALDPSAVQRLCVWLRAKPGRRPGSTTAPGTVRNYLMVIANMYRQRGKLADTPRTDPLACESASAVAGASHATAGSIPYIPDAMRWTCSPRR